MKSWAGGRGETTGPGLRPKLNPGGRDGQLDNPADEEGRGRDQLHDCAGGRKRHFLRPTRFIDLMSFCSSEIASFWSLLREPHSFAEGLSRHEN